MSSDAVVFIPGIKGTKLVNTNLVNFDTIWSGLQSNFETIQDLELTLPFNQKYYDEELVKVYINHKFCAIGKIKVADDSILLKSHKLFI